jgi:hypothetical protein
VAFRRLDRRVTCRKIAVANNNQRSKKNSTFIHTCSHCVYLYYPSIHCEMQSDFDTDEQHLLNKKTVQQSQCLIINAKVFVYVSKKMKSIVAATYFTCFFVLRSVFQPCCHYNETNHCPHKTCKRQSYNINFNQQNFNYITIFLPNVVTFLNATQKIKTIFFFKKKKQKKKNNNKQQTTIITNPKTY